MLQNVGAHPNDVVAVAAEKFDCSRQAVHKHLSRLLEQGAIIQTGTKRKPAYALTQSARKSWAYDLVPGLSESDIWERDVLPEVEALPKNALGIWSYAFTEMVNNAIDHSGSAQIFVFLECTAVTTSITVTDDGIGIFRKIQSELDLVDERQANFRRGN